MKPTYKYIGLLVAVFVLVVMFQMGGPRRINWEPSFTRADKIPYGSYILYDLRSRIFPGQQVDEAIMPLYNTLGGYEENTCYLIINSEFMPDKLDADGLLNFVRQGNSAFIAAQSFSEAIADSLGIETDRNYDPFGDSTSINLVNPKLRAAKNYQYRQYSVDGYFSYFDSVRTTVLGINADSQANYIKVEHGDGFFYLSSVPYAFTNYNLLYRNNADYVFGALSYIPSGHRIIWDEYYKDGRELIRTPLRYVLTQEPLRWGYTLLLVGVLLFVIFMGRRRQRVIPVIKPLPNTTLEFVETVGQLYYQHGDHRNIAEKKITYFLEHLRTTCNVNTSNPDEELYRVVAARSGVELDRVRSLFGYIEQIRKREQVSEDELKALNSAIEYFHAHSRREPAGRGRMKAEENLTTS